MNILTMYQYILPGIVWLRSKTQIKFISKKKWKKIQLTIHYITITRVLYDLNCFLLSIPTFTFLQQMKYCRILFSIDCCIKSNVKNLFKKNQVTKGKNEKNIFPHIGGLYYLCENLLFDARFFLLLMQEDEMKNTIYENYYYWNIYDRDRSNILKYYLTIFRSYHNKLAINLSVQYDSWIFFCVGGFSRVPIYNNFVISFNWFIISIFSIYRTYEY